jgi:proteasome assembly chaperone (PAC2) family protein
MAKQTINIGSAANDGTGSTLRAAFDITNDNFTELYDGTGGLFHKIEGTNFTGSLLIGHSTTGTLSAAIKNTGVGVLALDALTSGDSNTAIGYNAGSSINSGGDNVLIGSQAGDALTSGSGNVAIGKNALSAEDADGTNTAVGYETLKNLNAGANAHNTAIGYDAGTSLTTGIRNTLIIGYDAAASAVDVSNEVTIGDSNIANVRIPSDSTLKIGASGDLQIEHVSSNSFIKNTAVGDLYIENQVDDKDVIFRSDDGSGGLATYFYLDGGGALTRFSKRLRMDDGINLQVGSSGDMSIYHNGTDTFIDNATGHLNIRNQQDDGDIIFTADDGSGGNAEYFRLDGGSVRTNFEVDIKFNDSKKARFGAGDDLQIYHTGTASNIYNITGDLNISNDATDGDISFISDDGSDGTTEYFRVDGGSTNVVFSKDLLVNTTGGYFEVDVSDNSTKHADNTIAKFGTGNDLEIFHGGTNSAITNKTGNLVIKNETDDGDIIFESDDGSGGIAEYFRVDGGNTNMVASKTILYSDSTRASFGADEDLRISHDGSDSIISNNTGDLYIQNKADDKDILFKCDNGSGGVQVYFRLDGSNAGFTTFPDNTHLAVGTDRDFRMSHDGTDTNVFGVTGDIIFTNYADDKDIVFKSDDGSGGVTEYFRLDGGLGFSVVSKTLNFIDNNPISFGGGGDLAIKHDGTDSTIINNTGSLAIRNLSNDNDILLQSDDGSGGFTTYFTTDGSEVENLFNVKARFPDNVKLTFGGSRDLQIYHDASNSYIQQSGTGDLYIQNGVDDKDIILRSDDGSGGQTAYITLDGSEVSTVVNTIKVLMPNLPTSDPSVAGQLYTDSGVLKVSAG